MTNSTTTCSAPDASTTVCSTIYAQSTSTDQMVVNGFTAGEVVIITLLFLTFSVICIGIYHLLFRKIKIKNQ
jgi:hypothetical protein